MEITGLTIQQCAESFEKGDLIYLPDDIKHMKDELDELDLAKTIYEAIDYSNGFDRTPCQIRVARKDWILRKANSQKQT